MVKIKTSPENKNRVTISDLNSNIVKLTKVMRDSIALNKTYINDIQKARATSSSDSSSSTTNKKTDPSWYAAAGSEMWKATAPERGLLGSTIVGGLTGINPAIVQKMGIDKAIGSIFKSIKKDIKEKWAAAGLGSSNSKKVNSAIEANKVSPVTSRLDKIIKLMGLSKKTDAQQKSEEKGFLGKLFSFLGSVLSPLLKLASGLAILAGIHRLFQKLLDWLGIGKGEQTAEQIVQDSHGITKGGNIGANYAKKWGTPRIEKEGAILKAMRKQTDSVAKWKSATKKLTPEERARALSSEKELTRIAKEKKLNAEEIDNLKKARTKLRETNGTIKKEFTPKEQGRIREYANKKGNKPYNWTERNLVPKTKEGLPINRAPVVKSGLNKFNAGTVKGVEFAGKALKPLGYVAAAADIGLGGYEAYQAYKAGNEEKMVEALAGTGAGLAGMWAGGTSGAALGASLGSIVPGIGTAVGAVLGFLGGMAGGYFGSSFANQGARKLVRQMYGLNSDGTTKSEGTTFDLSDPVMQQIGNNRLSLNQTNIKGFDLNQYEKGFDEFLSSPASDLGSGKFNQLFSKNEKLNNWADSILGHTPTSYSERNTFGLTTDFNAPIQAADVAESPVIGIEQNTNTTNEILKNILSALETGQASAQGTNFGQFLETSELRRTMSGGNSGDKFPPNVRG